MNIFPFKNNPLNQMMNNPNFKQAMDYINANGGDPKTAFYKLAKEKGVDPEEMINKIKMFTSSNTL